MANPEAEEIVVGYLMNCYTIAEAEMWATRLDAQCFGDSKLRATFRSICQLIDQGEPVDTIHVYLYLLQNEPKSGIGPDKLEEWSQRAKTESIDLLVDQLREYKVRRNLQLLATRLLVVAQDTSLNVNEAVLDALAQLEAQDVAQQHHSKSLHDIVPELRQRIDDNRNPLTRHHGPHIGLDEIDSQGGLPETGLVVLAGGTSSGKSSVAAGILLRSADAGLGGLYISLEMPNRSLVSRMTAMCGRGLSGRDLLVRPLLNHEFEQALGDIEALDTRYGQLIHFDDCRSYDITDICTCIRQVTRRYGIRVAVVDFIQLLSYTMQGRLQNTTTEQLMGQAARRLKNLADRLGICIVMLSQLNRSMDRQRPTLGTVRDSGQIAEAADMVLLTWRPEQYHGQYDLDLAQYSPHQTMALLVAKHREGSLCDIIARWDGQRTLMRQLTSLELQEVMGQPLSRQGVLFD